MSTLMICSTRSTPWAMRSRRPILCPTSYRRQWQRRAATMRRSSNNSNMRLHIEHETIFSYSQPIREAIGEARLRPRDDAGQQVLGFRLALDPHTPVDLVGDRFGNTIHCYSVLPPHRRLVVTATSEVETNASA